MFFRLRVLFCCLLLFFSFSTVSFGADFDVFRNGDPSFGLHLISTSDSSSIPVRFTLSYPGSSNQDLVFSSFIRSLGYDYGFFGLSYSNPTFPSTVPSSGYIGSSVSFPFIVQVPIPDDRQTSFSISFDPDVAVGFSIQGPRSSIHRQLFYILQPAQGSFDSASVVVTYSDGSSDTVNFTDAELLSASFKAPSVAGQSYIDLSGTSLKVSGGALSGFSDGSVSVSNSNLGVSMDLLDNAGTGDRSYIMADLFRQSRTVLSSVSVDGIGFVDNYAFGEFYSVTGKLFAAASLTGNMFISGSSNMSGLTGTLSFGSDNDPIPVQHSGGSQQYIQSLSISGVYNVNPTPIVAFTGGRIDFDLFRDLIIDLSTGFVPSSSSVDSFGGSFQTFFVLNYGCSVGFSDEDFLAQIAASVRAISHQVSRIPSLVRSALVPSLQEVEEAVNDKIDDLIENNPTVSQINSTVQQIDQYEKQFVDALGDRSEAVITFFPMSFNMPGEGVIELSKPYILTEDIFNNAVFNAGKSVLNVVVTVFTVVGFLSFLYNFVLSWIAGQPYISFLQSHYSLDSQEQEQEEK